MTKCHNWDSNLRCENRESNVLTTTPESHHAMVKKSTSAITNFLHDYQCSSFIWIWKKYQEAMLLHKQQSTDGQLLYSVVSWLKTSIILVARLTYVLKTMLILYRTQQWKTEDLTITISIRIWCRIHSQMKAYWHCCSPVAEQGYIFSKCNNIYSVFYTYKNFAAIETIFSAFKWPSQ